MADHVSSSFMQQSTTWKPSWFSSSLMCAKTYSFDLAGTTHSRISNGDCKKFARRKVAGKVAALSSCPPSCLPARLYGWQAIPAMMVAGSGHTWWTKAAVRSSVMSAFTTGTFGCMLRCSAANFGWSSTAHFGKNPTGVKPMDENPAPEQSSM